MTKPIYEEITQEGGSKVIKRTDEDGSVWYIPTDPFNSDYQRYLNPDANQMIDDSKTK